MNTTAPTTIGVAGMQQSISYVKHPDGSITVDGRTYTPAEMNVFFNDEPTPGPKNRQQARAEAAQKRRKR